MTACLPFLYPCTLCRLIILADGLYRHLLLVLLIMLCLHILLLLFTFIILPLIRLLIMLPYLLYLYNLSLPKPGPLMGVYPVFSLQFLNLVYLHFDVLLLLILILQKLILSLLYLHLFLLIVLSVLFPLPLFLIVVSKIPLALHYTTYHLLLLHLLHHARLHFLLLPNQSLLNHLPSFQGLYLLFLSLIRPLLLHLTLIITIFYIPLLILLYLLRRTFHFYLASMIGGRGIPRYGH